MPLNLDQQRIQQFSRLELLARQVVEGFITGLHKSPYHGFSVEFAEHRLYNQGESTRHIDWKLYGRSDKLFVKRYEEETNLRCHLVLDVSSSMFFPEVRPDAPDKKNKLIFSIHACAALIELLKRQRDAVGLSAFSDKVLTHTGARSSAAHHKLLFHELERLSDSIRPENKRLTSVAQSLHHIAEAIHKRSLVMIFSDMMDSHSGLNELFNSLQHLRHNKHEVIVFNVMDKESEINFDFENRPYRFIDLETGEEIKLHPSEIRDHYIRSMEKLRSDLKMRCAQYRIDLVEADISEGFDPVLLQYLIKREKMQA